MKKSFKNRIARGILLTFIIGTGACSKDIEGSEFQTSASIIDVGFDGATFINSNIESVLSDSLILTESELGILVNMKEEEKLARDVYTAFIEKWKVPVFKNISAAEGNHLNAVLFLLKGYGDEYTTVGEAGKFTIPEFQDLYDNLTAEGKESFTEAAKAGALIEERDIKDLTESLEKVTNENVKIVLDNLRKGSRNHLRAFNRFLVRLNVTYTPQYLTQEEYNTIVSSPHEAGSRYPCWQMSNPQ